MSNDDLKFVEKAVLLILMSEGDEVANATLTNKYKIKVEVANRTRMVDRKLVSIRRDGQRIYWQIEDAGWQVGLKEFGSELPDKAGTGGAALYAILSTIKRYLDQSGIPYDEFFLPGAIDGLAVPDSVEVDDAEVEARIRAAYGKLARKPGVLVKLADLRDRLGDLPREHVDAVLVLMNRTPSVNVSPDSNQRLLTQRDRDAAVIIGNQDKHVISIGL